MRNLARGAFIGFAAFCLGLALVTYRRYQEKVAAQPVHLSCLRGLCQSWSVAGSHASPVLLLEAQPSAPIRLNYRSFGESPERFGRLSLINVSEKSIRGYGIKYEESGNAWREELFAQASVEPIAPGEERGVMSATIGVKAGSSVTLRVDSIEFADGTYWHNEGRR